MDFDPITARAHTNIALIKYWGKKDEQLIIPKNDSLSLTLDHFYTDTTVQFSDDLQNDEFYLNGINQDASAVGAFLDVVRKKANITTKARITSTNHVPTQAGLASSASAYAALALAASQAAHLSLDKTQLSRLARRGSGSACRSIFGGFVQWHSGHDDETSYASAIDITVPWDVNMIAVVVNAAKKKISSRTGMQRVVKTSPYYPAWVTSTTHDLAAIKAAMKVGDFKTFGTIAQQNALKMHALNLSASPAFNYFEPESIKVMNIIDSLQEKGLECYYTLDAGPNVKVICESKTTPQVLAALKLHFSSDQLLVAASGPGATIIK